MERRDLARIIGALVLAAGVAAGGMGLARAGRAAGPASSGVAQATGLSPTARTLTVTGSAILSRTADARLQANATMLNVGFEAQGDGQDAGILVGQVQAKAEALKKQLIGFGIDEKDIAFFNFSISPNYKPIPEEELIKAKMQGVPPQREVTGFRVSQNLNVRIGDLALLSKAMTAAIQAGATSVNTWQNDSAEPTREPAQRQEALKEAIQDARAQAEFLAGLLGVNIGAVQRATVLPGGPYGPDGTYRLQVEVTYTIE